MKFWDIIKSIQTGKKLIPYDEFPFKEYNAYVITKFLSFVPEYLPILNLVNDKKGCDNKAKYLHYCTLFKLIPKKFRRINIIKKKEKLDPEFADKIKLFQQYFQCRKELAISYMNLLDNNKIENILSYQSNRNKHLNHKYY